MDGWIDGWMEQVEVNKRVKGVWRSFSFIPSGSLY